MSSTMKSFWRKKEAEASEQYGNCKAQAEKYQSLADTLSAGNKLKEHYEFEAGWYREKAREWYNRIRVYHNA